PVSFVVLFLVGGRAATSAFTGENRLLDALVVYPFWIGLIINVQLFLVFLLADIPKLLMRSYYKGHRDSWREKEAKFTVGAVAFVAVYSLITVIANTWGIRMSEKVILLPSQFSNLDGMRIALISDTQGDGRTTPRRLSDFVERVNALEPDIIFFAGDVITSGEKYIESTAEILGKLRSRYGTYAAVGDHDIFSNQKRVVDALTMNGLRVVDDSSLVAQTEKGKLEITGITYTYRRRPDEITLARATNGNNGTYKIMLCHQPAEPLVEYARQKGYNLFLAGHTHGGGIAFGIPGVFLVAPASFETRYLSGMYKTGDLVVSVTNGLGFTLAPVRFHAPAEITLLRLKK
ncbi:MAG: metallophosphoesterase family protein, partial [Ignavibacteriales bacterium]|nr:metallophosphoesterase family protein [Ignavibacteriales bacterium]